ncbi:hypothetical protein [Micromonospora globispora]|uniref:hypothetical protein n=1 Tax=Micromonospora globispora TaxID=1450148 RepID=UPI000F5F082A|nr:hypothetical protein [Micromonospora globispora]RQW98679.1 hypothetical protein DKL51_09930 [Micromonospora globispora]
MSSLGYRDHQLIGLPEQVANVIRNHHSAGTLISLSAPRPVSPTDPRIRVALRLVDTTTPAPGPRPVRVTSLRTHITDRVRHHRIRRPRRVIAITTAAATAVAGLITAVVYLVAFLVDHAAIIAGLLAVTALILAALRSSGSGKRHCPGC